MKRTESEIFNIKENQNHDYIFELQRRFPNATFNRSEKNALKNQSNNKYKPQEPDSNVTETQIKKSLCALRFPPSAQDLQNKLLYFSQNEAKHDMYQLDEPQELFSREKFAIQYIGHATLLIQVHGFNILTDPVFYSPDKTHFPEKTKSHPVIQDLPKVHVILISYNRRDHLDKKSLQELLEHYKARLWTQPKLLVPLGTKAILKTYGFLYITELDWFSRLTIRCLKNVVHFISIPADQKYNKYQTNSSKSIVTGFIINPENDDVIFKYTGDTKALSNVSQQGIDAVIYNEITKKSYNIGSPEGTTRIPKIISFEPSGPNYTRQTVEVNHQSSSYSALLKFIECKNLSELSGIPIEIFLNHFKTVMFHHNKFQVGPDRFNEGLFVVKKLINYLQLSDDILAKEYERQKSKLTSRLDRKKLKENLSFASRSLIANLPTHSSILVRAKDFIINDIRQVEKHFNADKKNLRKILLRYIVNNTVFPLIGERMNNDSLMKSGLLECDKYSGLQMLEELDIENPFD